MKDWSPDSNRLARRAVVALGLSVSPITTAANVWLNKLHAFHHNKQESRYAPNHWGTKNIFEASADYCDELKTCSREAGKSDAEKEFAKLELEFRELADPRTDPHAIRQRVSTVPPPAVSSETNINAGSTEKPPARPAKADKPLSEPPSKVGGSIDLGTSDAPSSDGASPTEGQTYKLRWGFDGATVVGEDDYTYVARDLAVAIGFRDFTRAVDVWLDFVRKLCPKPYCLHLDPRIFEVHKASAHICRRQRTIALEQGDNRLARIWGRFAHKFDKLECTGLTAVQLRSPEENPELASYFEAPSVPDDNRSGPATGGLRKMKADAQAKRKSADKPSSANETTHVALLQTILDKQPTTLEKWARVHKLGRTTVFDWKAARVSGKSLKGKVSDSKLTAIEKAIEDDAKTLGLATRTDSD